MPTMTTAESKIAVAMIGHSFMGAAHSHAWRTAPRFFDLPRDVAMALVCGRAADRALSAARRLGWAEGASDWRRVIERDDIDLVDICTPGHTHAEIAIAALEAGKHVLCEKPLANSVAEAEAMTAAAEAAAADGIRAMVGFTYRRTPAIALARRLVEQGRIGDVRHVRAQYLQDWIADPEAPLSWRLEKDKAGSGALGDIGAHVIDLVQHVVGDQIVEVSALLETFVQERPLAIAHAGLSGEASSQRGSVTVDDAAVFLARLGRGGVGVFEATRFATGRKNSIRIEVNGSRGSLAYDFENMNVLEYYDATEPADVAGFRRILATEPTHPYVGAWWPPGHVLGYEHGFTHQVVDLVRAIADGVDATPTFADGLQIQQVLAAVETSSDNRTWQEISR
jgi:predicted dehydrogenase